LRSHLPCGECCIDLLAFISSNCRNIFWIVALDLAPTAAPCRILDLSTSTLRMSVLGNGCTFHNATGHHSILEDSVDDGQLLRAGRLRVLLRRCHGNRAKRQQPRSNQPFQAAPRCCMSVGRLDAAKTVFAIDRAFTNKLRDIQQPAIVGFPSTSCFQELERA